eukprot:scaffold357157_cov20-Prasinocladus_malaysianus.AAC.1
MATATKTKDSHLSALCKTVSMIRLERTGGLLQDRRNGHYDPEADLCVQQSTFNLLHSQKQAMVVATQWNLMKQNQWRCIKM